MGRAELIFLWNSSRKRPPSGEHVLELSGLRAEESGFRSDVQLQIFFQCENGRVPRGGLARPGSSARALHQGSW